MSHFFYKEVVLINVESRNCFALSLHLSKIMMLFPTPISFFPEKFNIRPKNFLNFSPFLNLIVKCLQNPFFALGHKKVKSHSSVDIPIIIILIHNKEKECCKKENKVRYVINPLFKIYFFFQTVPFGQILRTFDPFFLCCLPYSGCHKTQFTHNTWSPNQTHKGCYIQSIPRG